MASQRQASGRSAQGARFSVWTAITGALVGAVIVGAAWGVTSASKAAPSALATVNGKAITGSVLEKTLDAQYGSGTLQQMIENDLVADAAKDQHITASAAAIASAQEQIESAYGITSSAALASFLASNGLNEAQFQAILKNQVLEQQLAVSGVKVTNAEISAYYKTHESTFTAKGSKTEEPLSAVRGQIINDIKQSKALSAATLLAKLAKKYHVTVSDTRYKSVLTAIEDPSSSSSGG